MHGGDFPDWSRLSAKRCKIKIETAENFREMTKTIYKCNDCRDTGEILLLNSFVSCHCKKPPTGPTQVDPAIGQPQPSLKPENCFILRHNGCKGVEYYIIKDPGAIFGLPANTHGWAISSSYAGIIEIPVTVMPLLSGPKWTVFNRFTVHSGTSLGCHQIIANSWGPGLATPRFESKDNKNYVTHGWTPAYILEQLTNKVFTLA